jgi:thiol-disulfide isomerase/thioredoxin
MARRPLGTSGRTTLWLALAATAAAAPATAPTTAPTTGPDLLSQVDAAYAQLASAELDGHITAHLDVAGRREDHDVPFTSAFAGPTRFRHEVPGDVLVCSTGSRVFATLTAQDEYVTGDAPKGRAAGMDWPAGVGQLLADQNPSLLLALVPSVRAEFAHVAAEPVAVPPTRIDGVDYPSLRLDAVDGSRSDTLAFDPDTHLLRRATTDLRGTMTKAGATDVRAATVTVDYTTVRPGATFDADRFAYAPPAAAVVATAGPVADGDGAAGAGDDPGAAAALVGRAAPAFKLDGLNGGSVALADLRGKVVVLDMWATWCGPCVASMPGTDALFKDYQAKGAPVAVYAVDQTTLEQQGPDAVREFVKRKGWSLPVLLDTDGVVNKAYKADAIPEVVVIGKDGIVKKVFVGTANEEGIRAAVEAELRR